MTDFFLDPFKDPPYPRETPWPIVGISGKAGSGKDTLAALLVKQHGYHRRALADPIRELLNDRFDWDPEFWNSREWKETRNAAAGNKSPRDWSQWLGTEVGRGLAGDDVWVNALARDWALMEYPLLVVPDIRFNNEAEWIRSIGGIMVNVTRPGVAPVRSHRSEAGVDEDLIDLSLRNDGSPQSVLLDFTTWWDIKLTARTVPKGVHMYLLGHRVGESWATQFYETARSGL